MTKIKLIPKCLKDKKDPWMLAEDIPDLDFQFSEIWMSSFVNDLEHTVGINYQKVLCIYHGYDLKFYYGATDSNNFAKHVLGMIIKNPAFGERINKEIRGYSSELKQLSGTITQENLAKLNNQKLADLHLRLDKLHTTLYSWGWLPNAIDMFHSNFTNYLKDKLEEKISSSNANASLVALSVSSKKSIIDQENDSFLNLVFLKQKKKTKEFTKALAKHTAKYFYLKHLWIGKEGVYDEAHYFSEIDKFIASGQKVNMVKKQKEIERQKALTKRRSLIKKLKISGKLLRIFSIYSEFSITKLVRRDAQLFWAYRMDFFFAELSHRLQIPVMSCRFMFPKEIAEVLRKGKMDKKMAEKIKTRTKACVYYAEKKIDLIFTGLEVKKWEKVVAEKIAEGINEIKGQTACLGRVTGLVRIINSVQDMNKMNKGDILVSIATNPDIVPAMKKAAAIVTEQGGITSHAAIVSREFHTPCVIGTKIATKVLHDGDLVEVDANKGIVKIIKKNKN